MCFTAHVQISPYFSIWGFMGSFRKLIMGLGGNVRLGGSSGDLWPSHWMPGKSLKAPGADEGPTISPGVP